MTKKISERMSELTSLGVPQATPNTTYEGWLDKPRRAEPAIVKVLRPTVKGGVAPSEKNVFRRKQDPKPLSAWPEKKKSMGERLMDPSPHSAKAYQHQDAADRAMKAGDKVAHAYHMAQHHMSWALHHNRDHTKPELDRPAGADKQVARHKEAAKQFMKSVPANFKSKFGEAVEVECECGCDVCSPEYRDMDPAEAEREAAAADDKLGNAVQAQQHRERELFSKKEKAATEAIDVNTYQSPFMSLDEAILSALKASK